MKKEFCRLVDVIYFTLLFLALVSFASSFYACFLCSVARAVAEEVTCRVLVVKIWLLYLNLSIPCRPVLNELSRYNLRSRLCRGEDSCSYLYIPRAIVVILLIFPCAH